MRFGKEDLEATPYAAVGAVRGVWEQFIKPNPGILAWGATLAVPAMYDAWAMRTGQETMSHVFHRGYEHPMYRFLCVGALGALTLHLAHGLKDPVP